jgi:hypothetical protein
MMLAADGGGISPPVRATSSPAVERAAAASRSSIHGPAGFAGPENPATTWSSARRASQLVGPSAATQCGPRTNRTPAGALAFASRLPAGPWRMAANSIPGILTSAP